MLWLTEHSESSFGGEERDGEVGGREGREMGGGLRLGLWRELERLVEKDVNSGPELRRWAKEVEERGDGREKKGWVVGRKKRKEREMRVVGAFVDEEADGWGGVH